MKNLSELRIYRLSVDVSQLVWNEVIVWDKFAKWTLGTQFVNAADSISSNIIEGYYRYSKADQRRFIQYSFASAKETELWLWKAKERKLIEKSGYEKIRTILDNLLPQILMYIKSLK